MFGFQEVGHQEYKKNFLKVVVFSIRFKREKLTEEQIKKINVLFKDTFPRFSKFSDNDVQISFNNENIQYQKNEQVLKFTNIEGNKVIHITDNALFFQISGKGYKCFDKIETDLEKISNFLLTQKIDTIDRLAIRKINLIEFTNSKNPSDVLTYLLNPNLVHYLEFLPNRENINHSMHSLNYKNENNFLNIKYGLIIPSNLTGDSGQLVLDIDLYKQQNISSKDIVSISKKINQEIFNVFNWLISDETKKILSDDE
jgi:uncharacterized protein (TIGR04255 family)